MFNTLKLYKTKSSRRFFIKLGAGFAGYMALPGSLIDTALAESKSHRTLGNYPLGVSEKFIFVGLTLPLTGPYSSNGHHQLEGYKLAIKQLNEGDSRVKATSPLTKRGVLGKQIKFGVGDSETKPNSAVQVNTRWIHDKKAMMFAGCASSSVAIASEKLAQREKTIYMVATSGSNATTGKDCQRYGFRSDYSAYSSAKALAPTLANALGKNRKAVYLVTDYTFGHSVYNSMVKFSEKQGWKTVGRQLAPLGTSDFSTYLLNIVNSGADVFINATYGNDTINSLRQAKQFGILDKMSTSVPYMTPTLGKALGADIIGGVYGTQGFWWTLSEHYPAGIRYQKLAKDFVDAFEKEYGKKPAWDAEAAYLQTLLWADAVERAGTFYPPTVIKAFEKEVRRPTILGELYYRACDHQAVRPVPVLKGKKPSGMRNKDDFFEVVELAPGKAVIPSCKLFGCDLGSYT